MPTITFQCPLITAEQVMTVIRNTIAEPRPVVLQAGPRSIDFVDLPDASSGEATTVEADLRAQFPRQCVWDEVPVIIPLVMPADALVWTDMPSAGTEFRGITIYRTKFPLTNFREARLVANIQVVGYSTADIGVQASPDGGTTWYSLEGTLNNYSPVVSLASAGVIAGTRVNIGSIVATDVLIRLIGKNGDDIADPSFGNIFLQVR